MAQHLELAFFLARDHTFIPSQATNFIVNKLVQQLLLYFTFLLYNCYNAFR